MNKFFKTITAAALIAFAGAATAVPITGSIEFTGSATPKDDLNNTTTLGSAVAIAIDFEGAANTAAVSDVSGSFADDNIMAGDTGTYNSFVFSPTGPVEPVWVISGDSIEFTFDLLTMNVVLQEDFALVITGTGIISSDSSELDDTSGAWVFSANSAGQGTFSFSSSTAAPEPGMALLLGAGLIGFGLTRRLRKS